MKERNWEYNWLQISNRQKLFNFQIENVKNFISYKSEIYDNRNNHWAYTTNVTAGARLFVFSGVIYWNYNQTSTAYAELKKIIKVEDFPSLINRGFYLLKWKDKRWQNVQVKAKVYKSLETTEGTNETLKFEFTLLAEESFYYSQVEKTIVWGLGRLWGNTLPNILPNILLWGTDYIEVENMGESKAWLYINIIWELINPRITNLTTGQSMKIVWTTKNLVVDNREIPFIIKDEGINIKHLQQWEYIYLTSWINKIVISCENYIKKSQAEVYIKYRDTYE